MAGCWAAERGWAIVVLIFEVDDFDPIFEVDDFDLVNDFDLDWVIASNG